MILQSCLPEMYLGCGEKRGVGFDGCICCFLCGMVFWRALHAENGLAYEMSSFSETKTNKLLKKLPLEFIGTQMTRSLSLSLSLSGLVVSPLFKSS